jgi:hypothetical protein
LQFSKASAATLSQQENNDTADVQRGRVHIFGFIGTVVSWPLLRRTFDELESLAVALRRALNHWRMFVPLAPAAKKAGVWRHVWGDGAHCPSERHGAKYRSLNSHVGFTSFSKISNFRGLGCSRTAVAQHQPVSHRSSQFYVQRSSGFC